MLLRNLVTQPVGDVYKVTLYPEGNFETETSILDDNFTIIARTYHDFYTYFTIKLNNIHYLCTMTLARLGINMCYAPILTLDNKRHVFYLTTTDPTITRVHHNLFNNEIVMHYFQCPYNLYIDSIIA